LAGFYKDELQDMWAGVLGKTIVHEIRVGLMKNNSFVLCAKSNFLFLSGVILLPPAFCTSV
jgi:hypothetical protein